MIIIGWQIGVLCIGLIIKEHRHMFGMEGFGHGIENKRYKKEQNAERNG